MPVYLEGQEDNATTNFSFDQTGGSAKAFYYVESSGAQYLLDTVKDILGYTNPFALSGVSSGGQALQRTIPRTHPKFPFMYASKISSLVGMGSAAAVQSSPEVPSLPAIGSKPIANYQQFSKYQIGVEFTGPRPYAILDNGAFTTELNGSAYSPLGTRVNFTYAPEWVRYTDFDLHPQDNTIQGQTGQLSLVNAAANPGFIPFTSPPWMWLPDQILRVTWYQVPLRYIISPNSYIANRSWRGRINQNDWWLWPKGSLLYLGFNVKKYAPPTGDIQTLTNTLGSTIYINYAQLCDIELNFLLTRREMAGSLGGTITNGNYVAAGHNLLPNLADMQFYYAVTTTATASIQNRPPWLSFPTELLFSDPDVNTVLGL